MRKYIQFLVFLIFIQGLSTQAQNSFQNYLDNLKTKTGLETAQIGVSVIEENGNKYASLNDHLLFSPASTQKIVTTSTALLVLGPNHTFKTIIQYDGTFDASTGVLNGNIYIKGGADPTLGSEKFKSTRLDTLLNIMLTKIQTLGLKKINGSIIGDDQVFESLMAPGTWNWGDIGNYYGAGPCGLSVCDNMMYVHMQSSGTDLPTQILKTTPYYPNMQWVNDVKGGSKGSGDDAYIYGSEYSTYRYLKGSISTNQSDFKIKASLPDPPYFAAYLLDSILRKNNIQIKNSPTTTRILAAENKLSKNTKTEIFKIISPPLKLIIQEINVNSNNLYAEHLHKYLSYHANEKGENSFSNDYIKKFWTDKSIPTNEIFPVDGSGLSRNNAITPNALTQLLLYMKTNEYYSHFYESLPIAGVSGTIAGIGKGSLIENNLRAKSGSMNRIRCYTGYVKSQSGKNFIFSMMFNNFTCTNTEIKKYCEGIMIELAKN